MVFIIFTGVTFEVFDIICFCFVFKALDISQFLWWMCHKNETQFKILSLKSSHLSKFHQNPLTLHMPRNITAAQKHAQDFSESDVLAQTNQISYDSFFFFAWYRKQKKNIFSRSESRNKNLGHFFSFFLAL